jgi:tetratricopeptide (TPR) repeat protein
LLEESRRQLELALALDPIVIALNGGAPNVYLYLGDLDRFRRELPAFETPISAFYGGFAALREGETDAAREILAPAFAMSPSDVFARLAAALLALVEGDRDDARVILRQLELQRQQLLASDGEVTFKLAQLYAMADRPEAAMRALAEAVGQGFFCPPCLEDEAFRSLEGRPELLQLRQRAGERQRAFAERFDLPLTPADLSPSNLTHKP